jgi:hypothetical protein
MEMVLNLPLGRGHIRGPFSELWDEIFKDEHVEAERVWKLTTSDCKGRSFQAMANSAQSRGRSRKLRVITRQTPEALFLQVKADPSAHFNENVK